MQLQAALADLEEKRDAELSQLQRMFDMLVATVEDSTEQERAALEQVKAASTV